jgi:Ca2+-binding RTX toxin-like protein
MRRPSRGTHGGRRLPAAVVAVAAVLGLQVLVLAPAAHAGVVCSADTGTHTATVTVSGPGAYLVRVENNGSGILVNTSACGKIGPLGDPNAMDTIVIGGDPSAFGEVIIDVSGGVFGPGYSDEPNSDSDEIEWQIHGGTSGIAVFGSLGNDRLVVGTHSRVIGNVLTSLSDINLNGFQDGSKPDRDVEIFDHPSFIGLFGDEGNDVLSGQGTPGGILAGPSFVPIRLSDGPGADTVVGGAGDDEIRPGADPNGPDTYFGGTGFDVLGYGDRFQDQAISQDGQANDGIACPGPSCEGDNVGGDIEEIGGGDGRDVMLGGPGRQFLFGGGGNNSISGGSGNDVLVGGGGADDFHGGAGKDVVSYGSDFDVTVTLDGKPNDGQGPEGDNVHPDVEVVFGSSGADHLIGNAGPNELHGGPGNDVLKGMGGDDLLDGGGAAPRQEADPDDGSDVFFGGPGIDTVTEAGHSAGVIVTFDNLPNDAVVGVSEGSDNVHDDVENLIGTGFGDQFFGSPLANRFVGGGGSDRLTGAGGNDVLLPGAGTDKVNGGPGLDTVDFSDAAAAVKADLGQGTATGDGTDTLSGIERAAGSGFGDELIGSVGPNRLTGGAGNDHLSGLGGDDVLLGGEGDDTFAGGPGTDVCTQGPGSGSKTGCEQG